MVGISNYVFATKLKTLKNEINRWVKVEGGRLESSLNENLNELANLDNKEMEGILCEQGRMRREEVRKCVAAVMNLEAIS